MSTGVAEGAAELRLIPEFAGTGSIVEWLEKAELVCSLRSITRPENVIPLRLTGGAFAVYQQLSPEDKRDYDKIKAALYTAFAADSFVAYEQFVARKLQPGETVDVFLAELRKFAAPLGGVSDKVLACAFVAGLPESVRQLLRASSRMDELSIEQILARARAIMSDESDVVAAVSAPGARFNTPVRPPLTASGRVCFVCSLPNHLARDCLLRRRGHNAPRGGRRGEGGRNVRCHRCEEWGHIASSCPGNVSGERPSAPVSLPEAH